MQFPVTQCEVEDAIATLKAKNSCGYDFISNNLIKTNLTHVINIFFSKGIFPKKLKLSVIKPLLKKTTLN